MQEQNQHTKKTPSAKVNSLPELGKNQVDQSSRSARISKSLPSVRLTKMPSKNNGDEVATETKEKSSRSLHVMEVVSDEGTATPAYSDDFTDVSSVDDDDEGKTETPEEEEEREVELSAKVEDGITDVKKARQKLNSPHQKVLTAAINTLERLVKQLKNDIQNTKSDENAKDCTEKKDVQKNPPRRIRRNSSMVAQETQKNLSKILEEKEVIIDNLMGKLRESAAIIEERSEVVEKLLNRLLVSEAVPHLYLQIIFINANQWRIQNFTEVDAKPNISLKLHENERNWTENGRGFQRSLGSVNSYLFPLKVILKRAIFPKYNTLILTILCRKSQPLVSSKSMA